MKLSLKSGWKYKLRSGEKSLSKATVLGGIAYFTTFVPAGGGATGLQCSVTGGGGFLYAFHLHYGAKYYTDTHVSLGDHIPDTPQLMFQMPKETDENPGPPGMVLITPKIEIPKVIHENSPPKVCADGNKCLYKDRLTLRTTRSYIFKEEKKN